jgi:hypothetical protein
MELDGGAPAETTASRLISRNYPAAFAGCLRIVYVARGGNSEKLHELELRIQRIETVLSLSLKRTSGAAWTSDRVGW